MKATQSALYVGTIAHQRHIPRRHSFSSFFFMYYINLDTLEHHPSLGLLFSTRNWAFSRLYRPDYCGNASRPLHCSVKEKMAEITGHKVSGQVYGLMNMRNFGLYFSPVNFYYGFDEDGGFSHFLAEVSNIPWNERHYYGHLVQDGNITPSNDKAFKVSPFNPIKQRYTWNITPPGQDIGVLLQVDDERGHVFEACLQMRRKPMTAKSLLPLLLRRPVMAGAIVSAIYWQALKLYLKKVPYIPYTPHKQEMP